MAKTSRTRTRHLTDGVATALAAAAPAGWSEVTLTVSATVLAFDFAASVRLADGRPGDIELPAEVRTGFQELRREMYEPGRGTWFSAEVVVSASAEPVFSFNFDEDPNWWPALLPTAFCRDLDVFPRDDEHIPGWLAEQLAEGERFDAQHRGNGPVPS